MKKTHKNKFSYWFDNLMSGGTIALVRVLLAVIVALLLVLGLTYSLV